MDNSLLLDAQSLIDSDDQIIYDIAAYYGQKADNIRHTKWLLYRVADYLETGRL